MTWPNENKIPEYLQLPEDHPLTAKIRKIDDLIKDLGLDFQFSKGQVGDIATGYYVSMRSSWRDNKIKCFIPNDKWIEEKEK